ncbi:hypothetical protein MHLP_04065 [Candidatus Mycoplasma haematolamae str. Purdue]|uniref:Uncharacterized protein n=1 Tax=Mycoplasma haematolamae (strain Purdue) TaxID=1212765 RepID=I7BKH6_MYCHA|nr:hypothetical protein [Candidatus Mycoplasma haematolamae]AFO52393.1 hypothetical protein MHLP_04065 [Candidatus Mycoplasma haematolamae str. Purdue]
MFGLGAGGLRIVSCAMVGGGLFTAGGFGVDRAVRGGGQSTYRLGQKFCSPQHPAVCLVFGERKEEGFMTEGVWLNESGGAQKIDSLEWINYSGTSTGQTVPLLREIFEKFQGLKEFTVKKVSEYKDRNCVYQDHQDSSSGLWYDMKCSKT